MIDNNYIEYKDKIAFHPGSYLKDIIDDYNMTQEEFAKRMGVPPKTISTLVNGLSPITPPLALKISSITGSSVEMWTNLQSRYDIEFEKIQQEKSFEEEYDILKQIDFSYFVRNGFLAPASSKTEKTIAMRSFLKVADLRLLGKRELIANYKTVSNFGSEKNIICANVWLQLVLNRAESITTKPFDEKMLRSQINSIREMTLQHPTDFLPNLFSSLNDSGVALVLMPHLPKSGIHGVTKWITKEKVVIGINDRTYRADSFWFTLFHELSHVLQVKLKSVFVEFDHDPKDNSQDEMIADQYAKNILIPQDEFDSFIQQGIFHESQIRLFSEQMGIHPGIVVGRLQHEGLIPFNQLNHMIEKYTIRVS